MLSKSKNKIRVGIVGCGAIVEINYIPALKQLLDVEVTVVVDKNIMAAKKVASFFSSAIIDYDYRNVVKKVDAVIIALPNVLHSEVACFFLSNGIHVLCEKPMAVSSQECDKMIAFSKSNNVKLMIGHVRRYFPNSFLVKDIISRGWLGQIKTVTFKDGGIFGWSGMAQSYFDKKIAGGGVLMDIGPHVLDLLIWWLGFPLEIDYYDDNYGGVEANCKLNLKFKNGILGSVKLSRTVSIEKIVRVVGEEGWVEYLPYELGKLKLSLKSCNKELFLEQRHENNLEYYFRQQIRDFICYIEEGRGPLVSLDEARFAVQVIEHCYCTAKKLTMPWVIGTNPVG